MNSSRGILIILTDSRDNLHRVSHAWLLCMGNFVIQRSTSRLNGGKIAKFHAQQRYSTVEYKFKISAMIFELFRKKVKI